MISDEFLQNLLSYLLNHPQYSLWVFFLIENLLITASVLISGRYLQKKFSPSTLSYSYSHNEWFICLVTNIINTLVTYAGFVLWKYGYLNIQISVSVSIVLEFILLFLAMDFLMYVFHFLIHKTFLYKAVHDLHHRSVDPKPIDLFVLHPVETISFGSLWLLLLLIYPFNFYAILLYLTVNVIFGLIGHLGLEPIPERFRKGPVLKFLGTSTFHHQHHQNLQHNFGFYTSIWDRLFGTLKS